MYIAYTAGAGGAAPRAARLLRGAAHARDPRGAAPRHGIGPTMRAVVRRMGRDGWLGIGWPKEYGGQGRGADRAVHLLRRVDALRRAGADAHDQHRRRRASCATARDEQKRFFLPRILEGEIHFCIGYTEPSAGTDLAALTTRAVRDGDDVRDRRPEGLHEPRRRRRLHLARGAHGSRAPPKHAGISIFAVDLKTPGIRDRSHAPALGPRHQHRRSSTTCACRRRAWSAARTRAGS